MYKRYIGLLVILIVSMIFGSVYSKPLVDKPVTLTFMRPDAENPVHSLTRETPLIWQWWEEATGIHIQPVDVVPEQDYKNVFNLKVAAGQVNADLIDVRSDNQGTQLVQYGRDGLLMPLNDLIDKYAPNIKALMKKYPKYKIDLTAPDGKIYAISSANASRYMFMTFLVRKDWLDKLGLKVPDTLEDFYKTAIAFVKHDPNGNGKADEIGVLSPDRLWGLNELACAYDLRLCTGGGFHIREDGRITYDFIMPEAKEFLKFLNKCVKDGAIPPYYDDPSVFTGAGSLFWQKIYDSQLGIYIRAIAPMVGPLNDPKGVMKKNDPKARWVATLPPLMPNGKRAKVTEQLAMRWRTYGITTKCKDPVAAIKWLDFVFASKEGREIYLYGKEGVTFKRNPDGSIERIVTIDTSKDEIATGPFAGKWWGSSITMPILSDDAWTEAQFKIWQTPSWAINSVKANFKYLVAPFQAPMLLPEEAKEVTTLLNDITTYKNEMWAKFVAGDIPITDENFNNYVNRIKQLGIDRIIEIYQKAFARVK
jgi:putative aldouronate transport system substrate-binding protein